jgi:hypothetical protein
LLLALGIVFRRRAPRSAFLLLAVPVALLPFALIHPAGLIDDTVLFPLGLAEDSSGVHAPTLGSQLMSRTGADHQHVLALLLVVVAVALTAWYVGTRRIATVAEATQVAGVVLGLLVVLAPVARPGYAIYPMNVMLWGFLLRERAARHAVENVRRADSYAYARAGT